MKDVFFNPKGGKILVSIVYEGSLEAAYGFKLSEAGSNKAVMYQTGDNLNAEDDKYFLPIPTADNDQRIARLSTEFVGLDIKTKNTYTICLEFYQDNILMGKVEESDQLTGKAQSSLLFVKLIAKS